MTAALALLGNKYVQYGLAAIGLFLALWAWGNSRYNAGVSDTDAQWEAASAALIAQAEEVDAESDEKSLDRKTEYSKKLKAEKELIDEAQRNGDSVFDALFPSSLPAEGS